MQRLFTHEDSFNSHKIFGFFCLINYLFQMINFLVFGTTYLNYYTIIPHMLLHITSLIFKVLPTRPTNSKLSMFIWTELRLHALIFGFRSCLSILFPQYALIWMILTLIGADVATYLYGTPGVSSVRGNLEKHGSRGFYKETLAAFFSLSQVGATIIVSGLFQSGLNAHIGGVTPLLAFLTLPPIQTSAFGMTLLRKNLITKETWSFVYSIELLLVYIFWFIIYGNINVFFMAIPFYLLRRQNISKYIIWFGYIAVDYYIRHY